MADTRDNGRNELTYVSTTDPGSVSASRLPANYTVVGLVLGDTLTLNRNMIPADDKSAGDYNQLIVGRISGQVQIQGHRAKDGNAGMKIVRDALQNGTLLYFLKSDNTVGDEAVYGTAYVESYEEGSDDEAVRTANATLVTQGQIYFFTIQT